MPGQDCCQKQRSDDHQFIKQHETIIVSSCYSILRIAPNYIEYDDLYQEGVLGLMKARDLYQSGGGATFVTYAYIKVRGYMFDYLRSFAPEFSRCVDKRQIANRTISIDDVSIYDLPATNNDEMCETLDRCRLLKQVHDEINRLNEKDRNIVKLHLIGGMSLREIGVIYGVSGSRISQICIRAARRIKQRIGGEQHVESYRDSICRAA